MERNITIGLIIAFILVICGAFLMHKDSNGAGFLLDFLKNHTDNTTTADNSTINETINQTINETATNITENSTVVNQLSFSIAAVYDNSTNSSLVSITSSQDNITVNELALFMSYDNSNFTKVYDEYNVTLPTAITVPINDNATAAYFYATISYNNTLSRVPENGSEVLNLTTNS